MSSIAIHLSITSSKRIVLITVRANQTQVSRIIGEFYKNHRPNRVRIVQESCRILAENRAGFVQTFGQESCSLCRFARLPWTIPPNFQEASGRLDEATWSHLPCVLPVMRAYSLNVYRMHPGPSELSSQIFLWQTSPPANRPRAIII